MLLLFAVILVSSASYAYSTLGLQITPLESSVVLEENADLNLTCKVVSKTRRSNSKFDLTWMLPLRSHSFSDRVTVAQGNEQLSVTIHNLQEDDTGIYVCKLQDNGIMWNKKISVFVRTKKCVSPFFDCGGGVCISKHYVCDGYVDCPSGYDEAFNYCGPDACNGKILCDGRCIPKELCCDPLIDANCTVGYVMPCCSSHIVRSEGNGPMCSPPESCRSGHYTGFGNSILYIVASCAGILLVISVAMVFLACRLCSRHSEELHHWARIPATDLRHHYPLHPDSDSTDNADLFFDDSDPFAPNPDDFVLVNFVPGVGFEIADCGPKPPPYTENIIGIPPPPYESQTDVSEIDKTDMETSAFPTSQARE